MYAELVAGLGHEDEDDKLLLKPVTERRSSRDASRGLLILEDDDWTEDSALHVSCLIHLLIV